MHLKLMSENSSRSLKVTSENLDCDQQQDSQKVIKPSEHQVLEQSEKKDGMKDHFSNELLESEKPDDEEEGEQKLSNVRTNMDLVEPLDKIQDPYEKMISFEHSQ